MCNWACISFVIQGLSNFDLRGKDVLEIGSYNVNGTVSIPLKLRSPKSYIGVDMVVGPCVDEICNVYDIVDRFGPESFDIVITTEMLEHVKDWRLAINNMKTVCRPNGHILITTRSFGFPMHGYPDDHWRFEIDDMMEIFSDCVLKNITVDVQDIGVFIHVVKPEDFTARDLTNIALYNINTNSRVL